MDYNNNIRNNINRFKTIETMKESDKFNEFKINNREFEITEYVDSAMFGDHIELKIDGSIGEQTFKKIEKDYKCKLHLILPYTRHGGAHWLVLIFKIK